MADPTQVFWNDLKSDLEDPEFLREYIIESVRIQAIDSLINELEKARENAGLSKAEVARAINTKPEVIRRMLSNKSVNPTLGTLAEVAAVLGYSLSLTPFSAADDQFIKTPLQTGVSNDLDELAKRHRSHQVA
ncbi:MAG: helix-turn-helix transcriptional regulator [Glaciihabitans sp.]|jgi:transcriptional regulator with XRE-family HTH domain|nr:helix-turn-helix transcriptional regulator [Glaciihabitans sp.]